MLPEHQPVARPKVSKWLEHAALRHPKLFDLALGLLAVLVTIVLLLKTGYTLVLYQGF